MVARTAGSLKSTSGRLVQTSYHMVLTPKARYPVFAQAHQRTLAEAAIMQVCNTHNIIVYKMKVLDDHVHLRVSCPPGYSVSKLVGVIKGGSSHIMRQKQPSLQKYRGLWNAGHTIRSIDNSIAASVVDTYIDNQ